MYFYNVHKLKGLVLHYSNILLKKSKYHVCCKIICLIPLSQVKNMEKLAGERNFLYSRTVQTGSGAPTQSPIQWVARFFARRKAAKA
jgi:hypothetical protein